MEILQMEIAKREFYQAKFETTSSDPNKKWEFVYTVLNRKNVKMKHNCLKIDDQKLTEKYEIAEKFNEFYQCWQQSCGPTSCF